MLKTLNDKRPGRGLGRGLCLGLGAALVLGATPAKAGEFNLKSMRAARAPAFSVTPSFAALQRTERSQPVRRLEFKRRPRVVPLAWELAGLFVGAGVTAAGVAFSALHGKCARSVQGEAGLECGQVYHTQVPGMAMLTSGVMIFGSAVVMMLIDARRGWEPAYRYLR